MEPVSVGNFGSIAFAWVLLRDRSRIWIFVAKMLAIATILVLADARFGFYLCIFTIVIYLAAPIIRPAILFFAPFLAIIGAGDVCRCPLARNLGQFDRPDDFYLQDIPSRSLDPWQVLGLRISNFFVSGYAGDSGYGYALVKVGLVGLAAIWALFIYAPHADGDTWRFKNFIAFYIVFLLTVSASLFSIKTAALLWFLYGTLNNQNRAGRIDIPGMLPGTSSESA